jgi:hypothetical protein
MKRMSLERGRVTRSDRESLAERCSAAVAGCPDSARLQRCLRGGDLETVSRALGDDGSDRGYRLRDCSG